MPSSSVSCAVWSRCACLDGPATGSVLSSAAAVLLAACCDLASLACCQKVVRDTCLGTRHNTPQWHHLRDRSFDCVDMPGDGWSLPQSATDTKASVPETDLKVKREQDEII